MRKAQREEKKKKKKKKEKESHIWARSPFHTVLSARTEETWDMRPLPNCNRQRFGSVRFERVQTKPFTIFET